MFHINIEIKARCSNPNKIRKILKSEKTKFKGVDYQMDTYFRTNHGRLKLREGKIENYLVYYSRKNQKGPKQSNVVLFKTKPKSSIKEILTKSLGVFVVVDKKREIYFIKNVKFHIDKVKGLGNFIEIEAIDRVGNIGKQKLMNQCQFYLNLFGVPKKDLVSESYSDLVKQKSVRNFFPFKAAG